MTLSGPPRTEAGLRLDRELYELVRDSQEDEECLAERVRELVYRGASGSANGRDRDPNHLGETALSIALRRHQWPVIDVLLPSPIENWPAGCHESRGAISVLQLAATMTSNDIEFQSVAGIVRFGIEGLQRLLQRPTTVDGQLSAGTVVMDMIAREMGRLGADAAKGLSLDDIGAAVVLLAQPQVKLDSYQAYQLRTLVIRSNKDARDPFTHALLGMPGRRGELMVPVLRRCFLEWNFPVDQLDGNGHRTLLQAAAHVGCPDVVRLLLECGADADRLAGSCQDPAHVIAGRGKSAAAVECEAILTAWRVRRHVGALMAKMEAASSGATP